MLQILPPGVKRKDSMNLIVDEGNNLTTQPGTQPGYTAIVDGGTNGLNGRGATSGYGSWKIYDDTGKCVQFHRIENACVTNNENEYATMIDLLQYMVGTYHGVTVYSDSALVVNQINGKWRVKSDNLKSMARQAKELKERCYAEIVWRGKHERGGTFEKLGH